MLYPTTKEETNTSKRSVDAGKGIVLYTDGSCRPNPGHIGWGVHGYLYELKEVKKPLIVDNHFITNKGYLLGPKVVESMQADMVEPTQYFDFCGAGSEIGSNNLAEILALYHALPKIEETGVKHVMIRTDSEYMKNCVLSWCAKWASNNWLKTDGSPISNVECLKVIHGKLLELRLKGVVFDIIWVRGHAGNLGNTQADALAVIGMLYSRAGVDRHSYSENDARGYWKNEVEKHPFINFKRVYFNSIDQFNTPGHYFQADSGAGDFIIGKPIPESGFSVIKLTEPDAIIESVKEAQYQASNNVNAIAMIKLDRAYGKDVYPYLKIHGKHCLMRNRSNMNMNFVDDQPVTLEINPTGLSLRAIESFNFLEEVLAKFMQRHEELSPLYIYHDVTEHFFDKTEKLVKKEPVTVMTLKASLGNAVKTINVPIVEQYQEKPTTLEIPLIMGLDILHRNNLKKLEAVKPKVYIVTWRESLMSLRYATIIECDSGIGIWANYFANKVFFK